MNIKDYKFYQHLTNLPFIQQIWLFGSRARGDHQERADLDLAILCNNPSFENWLKISSIIDSADTLLKIDCVKLNELPDTSTLKAAIMQQGIKLYEKQQ